MPTGSDLVFKSSHCVWTSGCVDLVELSAECPVTSKDRLSILVTSITARDCKVSNLADECLASSMAHSATKQIQTLDLCELGMTF